MFPKADKAPCKAAKAWLYGFGTVLNGLALLGLVCRATPGIQATAEKTAIH